MKKTLSMLSLATLGLLAVGAAQAVVLSDGNTVPDSWLADQGVAFRYTGTNTAFYYAAPNEALGKTFIGDMGSTTVFYGDPDSHPSLALLKTVDTDPATFDSIDPTNAVAGNGEHAYMEVNWSGRTISNQPGNDVQISDTGSAEGLLMSVKSGGVWTGWLYVVATAGNPQPYSNYDLDSYGLALGATVSAIRLTNTLSGPGQDDYGHSFSFALDKCDPDPTYVSALSAPTAIPEPTCLLALGCGLLGILGRRQRA